MIKKFLISMTFLFLFVMGLVSFVEFFSVKKLSIQDVSETYIGGVTVEPCIPNANPCEYEESND